MWKQILRLTLQALRVFRHTPWHHLYRCICLKGSRDDVPLRMISPDKLYPSLMGLTRASLLLTLQAGISQQLQLLGFVLNSTRFKMPTSSHEQEVQQGRWGSSLQVTLHKRWIRQRVGVLSCLKGDVIQWVCVWACTNYEGPLKFHIKMWFFLRPENSPNTRLVDYFLWF